MNWRSLPADARVRVVSGAILLVGLASAILIYVVSVARDDTPGYQPEESKQYLREMEVYGGKANLLAGEFRIWFTGPWHGRSLAVTVAILAILLALVYRVAATPLPSSADGGPGHAEDGDGTGP